MESPGETAQSKTLKSNFGWLFACIALLGLFVVLFMDAEAGGRLSAVWTLPMGLGASIGFFASRSRASDGLRNAAKGLGLWLLVVLVAWLGGTFLRALEIQRDRGMAAGTRACVEQYAKLNRTQKATSLSPEVLEQFCRCISEKSGDAGTLDEIRTKAREFAQTCAAGLGVEIR